MLDAAKQALQGISGTVAELISTPARFDTAIEVAMGSHLQDVVVERWEDAEQAIALLKRSNSGRATFQPLDSVKLPRSQDPEATIGRRPGVHGVASAHVTAAGGVERVVAGLLGRTLVVEDLDIARAVLPQLPGGWNVVTIAGEIVRSGGSVTGGSAVRESGVLGRERELRVPGRIATIEREREEAIQGLALLTAVPERLAEERRELEGARAALVATRRERAAQQSRMRAWLEELSKKTGLPRSVPRTC